MDDPHGAFFHALMQMFINKPKSPAISSTQLEDKKPDILSLFIILFCFVCFVFKYLFFFKLVSGQLIVPDPIPSLFLKTRTDPCLLSDYTKLGKQIFTDDLEYWLSHMMYRRMSLQALKVFKQLAESILDVQLTFRLPVMIFPEFPFLAIEPDNSPEHPSPNPSKELTFEWT